MFIKAAVGSFSDIETLFRDQGKFRLALSKFQSFHFGSGRLLIFACQLASNLSIYPCPNLLGLRPFIMSIFQNQIQSVVKIVCIARPFSYTSSRRVWRLYNRKVMLSDSRQQLDS